MTDWTDHRETLEIESNCHKALLDSPVAHSRIAEAIDAALAQIDRLTTNEKYLTEAVAQLHQQVIEAKERHGEMVVECARRLAMLRDELDARTR
jgi:hypothetical protein